MQKWLYSLPIQWVCLSNPCEMLWKNTFSLSWEIDLWKNNKSHFEESTGPHLHIVQLPKLPSSPFSPFFQHALAWGISAIAPLSHLRLCGWHAVTSQWQKPTIVNVNKSHFEKVRFPNPFCGFLPVNYLSVWKPHSLKRDIGTTTMASR